MSKIEITILPEDVEASIKFKLGEYKIKGGSWASHCPIAEAVHRQTGIDYEYINIQPWRAHILHQSYSLPTKAVEYIDSVDRLLNEYNKETFNPAAVESGATFILPAVL